MISSPPLASIFLRSSSTHPPLLTLISICFLSPPFALSLLLLLLLLHALSYLHLSQSLHPQYQPPLANFRFSANVCRLDAYCCYRNQPFALDYNVTLSPHYGYNICSFLCSTRYRPAYLLCVGPLV